jgi:hypothetical protein
LALSVQSDYSFLAKNTFNGIFIFVVVSK